MAQHAEIPLERSDTSIESDIHRVLHGNYPPLKHDRHRIKAEVVDGVITLTGYVRTQPTFAYLMQQLNQIPGVQAVRATQFFNDEAIRLSVGHVVPMGVQVNVEYGAVILTGKLPEGMTVEDVVKQVGLVPGVHRVLTRLS